MSKYYKEGRLDPQLLDSMALAVANKIFIKSDEKKPHLSISSAQLRRFYNDFKNLEKKLESKGGTTEAFLDILPLVKMAKSKVGYARGTKKIPTEFEKWIKENVDNINELRDFKAFLLYFEAVVGFCYSLGMSNK